MPRLFLLALLIATASCTSYRQNVMFKPTEGFTGKKLIEAQATEKNYVIQVNDYLKVDVYTNKGERLIDPNNELVNSTNGRIQNSEVKEPTYLVTIDGTARLPMIGPIALAGMTIREAEVKLQAEYDQYFKQCYVILAFSNKRVIVLGSPGGQVIPLINENVSVIEVLAMAKGIGNDGKAHNVRLIRGNDVYFLDLSTLDGLKGANTIVQPGDIVYVEPIRRPFAESIRDLSPLLTLTVSVTSLIIVFLANR
jgi:polysaccharide export outer membrane protein